MNLLELHSTWAAISTSYTHIITCIVPGPRSLSYFVPFVLLPVALLIPPDVVPHQWLPSIFLPPIYAGIFHAWYAIGGVDVISMDGLLWSTYLIGFKDVRREFARLRSAPTSSRNESDSHRGSRDGKTPPEPSRENGTTGLGARVGSVERSRIVRESYPSALYARLRWVLSLLSSARMSGWSIGDASHDRRQEHTLLHHPSRRAFVLDLLPALVVAQLLLPLCHQMALYEPTIQSIYPAARTLNPPTTVSLIQYIVPAALRVPLLHGLFAYACLITGFALPAPLIVATNYLFHFPPDDWSPHTLPHYFGPFSSVLDHGVAGVWGRWWHQNMRVMLSASGPALADYLGLLESSDSRIHREVRYSLHVVAAFFFSGVTHTGLVPPGVAHANSLRWRIAGFFWLQAISIILERSISLLLRARQRTMVRNDFLKPVRLVWAIIWLSLTLRLLERPFDELGWWKLWPIPVPRSMGALKWWMEGGWIP